MSRDHLEPGRESPWTRHAGRALAGALALACLPAHANDPSDLARESVEARFVADPRDARRDLITGRTREELEADALARYEALRERDAAAWRRMSGRPDRARTAAELVAIGRDELAAGRPLAAEIAWERALEVEPHGSASGRALLHLASARQQAGDLAGAARHLARVPEVDLGTATYAAPLVDRLVGEIDLALQAGGATPTGRWTVQLHPTLAPLDLDATREMAEWTSGWSLADEAARELRIETSGDALRVVKNVGQDVVPLDALVPLVPREHRMAGLLVEERLRGHDDLTEAVRRAEARGGGKLDRLADLSRLQQLQVVLLGRSLARLELAPDAKELGRRTLEARRGLVERAEGARTGDGAPPDERAVAQLVALADANGDGKLTPLRDDEGLLRPSRFAVEGDIRNAGTKPLDDDNPKRIAELFERTGLSEKALFAELVRATSVTTPDAGALRLSPERVAALAARLAELAAPVHAATAGASKRPPARLEAERDYLARLNVLRAADEGLADVLRREVLDRDARAGSAGTLAARPETVRLVAELASLGTRVDGAWLYADDPPRADGSRGMSADEKLERAQALRADIDRVAADSAMAGLTRSLVADFQAQGLTLETERVPEVEERLRHEDLGTLAFVFDELGRFTKLERVVAFTRPGTQLGSDGPGHVAYGFGLDLAGGDGGANLGWRDGRELAGGTELRYHVGATGLSSGAADLSGVSAGFRTRRVWQPQIGMDGSVLRGFAARGQLSLVRDVALKHARLRDRAFADHDAARRQGARAFASSLAAPGASARAVTLFLEGLGHDVGAMSEDDESLRLLADSYAFERARRRAELDRGAHRVRFAGLGLEAAFFGGEAFLLVGPRLAIKDYQLRAQWIGGGDRRLMAAQALERREAIALGEERSRVRTESLAVELVPGTTPEGRPQLVAGPERVVVAERELGPAPAARAPVLVASREAPRGLEVPEPARPGGEPLSPLARLGMGLAARGVPLDLRATERANAFEVVPARTTPWASQSIELYVEARPELGLQLDERGRVLLLAPAGGARLVMDWLEEVRAITRKGEADELHRVTISTSPGLSAAEVIESAGWVVRMEVVDGRLVGAVRLATGHLDAQRKERVQANVLAPGDADASARAARIEQAARGVQLDPPLELPPAVLVRRAPASDATAAIVDPALLADGFLRDLRRADAATVRAFKERGIVHARWIASGEDDARVDAESLAWIQERSLAHHGVPVAGRALDHAAFVLTHESLDRVDDRPFGEQVVKLEERALTPFALDREIGQAAPERTRRLIAIAGVDEAAALKEIREGVSGMAARARATGRFPDDTVEPGTRIVTASAGRGCGKGVQWTTATEPVPAHLLDPFPLGSNAGRYIAAHAIGADLDALAEAIRAELDARDDGDHAFDVDADLLPALGLALAQARDDRTLRVRLAGLELEIAFAGEPRAGALARCKNATIFPPGYSATLRDRHATAITAVPTALIGRARTHSRVAALPRIGWRTLGLLGGGLLPHVLDGGGGGGGGGTSEPPTTTTAEPPREGRPPAGVEQRGRPVPPDRPGVDQPPPDSLPPRDGTEVPSGGRHERPDPPERPYEPEGPAGGGGNPRDEENPGGGGRPGRPDPPDRPNPEPEPPREGEEPPPRDRGDRPQPPEPPDRPRRPVD